VEAAAHVSRSTLVVLLLVVLGLSWAAWSVLRSEERSRAAADVRLFEDLDENEIVALRIENLGRDLSLRLERDPSGGWRITDPVEARAEPAPPDLIVQSAMIRRGTEVEGGERELARYGLDPPRFVLEVESERGGARTRQRAEFGAVDPDGERMYVHVRGMVVRALRDLEPLLDLQLHEFRSSAVSRVDPRDVVEIHRRGTWGPDGASLAFDAVREGDAWTATAPVRGRLDPGAMALYALSTAGMRRERVVDEGLRALASLGLDPPELEIELGSARAEPLVLRFGRGGARRAGGWNACALGDPTVWSLAAEDLAYLATPLEEFFDHKLHRLARSAVTAIELSAPGGEVQIARQPLGWTVAAARFGSRVFEPPLVARRDLVEDLLGELERFELEDYRVDLAWEDGPAPHRFALVAGGERVEGVFGAAYAGAGGGTSLRFRRAGEDAVALADPAILDWLAKPAHAFWSLTIRETSEADLARIALERGGRKRVFVRNARGLWVPEGGELEARELRGVLDPLLFLKASEHLGRGPNAALGEALRVELTDEGQRTAAFTFGWTGAGEARRAEVEHEGRRSVLAQQGLLSGLEAVLAGG
jgi:hypothetical protein